MTDREKVIKGLECWSNGARQCNNDCPYRPSIERMSVVGVCDIPQLCKDALELLKAKDTNVLTKWISAKDRLPEAEQYVLTIDKLGFYYIDCVLNTGEWEENTSRINPVTHWLPLPEPPKEKT